MSDYSKKILGLFDPGDNFDCGLRIVDSLNPGGQAGVVLAERTDTGELVALKLIFVYSQQSIRDYEREKDILTSLDDPGIVKLVGHGWHKEKLPYLVLAFVKGVELVDFADDQKMPIRDRCRLFCRACEIVARLHRIGISHCDLKPSNFLISAGGEITLIDFGSAFAKNRPDHGGNGRENIGTEAYMSPEQVRGDALDELTDVYSLGVMFYELLCGDLPYADEDKVKAAILQGIADPPSKAALRTGRRYRNGDLCPMDSTETAAIRGCTPNELVAQLTPCLDGVVSTAMHVERKDRFASVEAFIEAIGKCVG